MGELLPDRNRVYVIVAVIVAVGILLSLCAGALAGGVVAFTMIRSRLQPSLMPVPAPEERSPSLPFPFRGDSEETGGALIQEVRPNTPADEAGLRVGDIIIAVDGQPVDSSHPLNELIGARKPGDRVEITILRGGRQMTIGLALGEHPNDPERAFLGVSYVPIFLAPQGPER